MPKEEDIDMEKSTFMASSLKMTGDSVYVPLWAASPGLCLMGRGQNERVGER